MNTWNNIAWFPICVGLTAAGLFLSWLTWRRKGARRGIRAAAWSLLPLALYLTGSILLVGRIGSAIVRFANSFVFSPRTWSGVVLLCVAVLIFLVTGGIPLPPGRKRARKKEARQQDAATGPDGRAVTAGKGATAQGPAKAVRQGKGAPDSDGLDADVAEILRRRGIT